MGKNFREYSDYLAERFDRKMQKLTVNAGFTCPNRDGTKGWGGCTYCNNQAFNPTFAERGDSITEQLTKAKTFFARKYPDMHYLAYFQAYTNTHSSSISHLMDMYHEALAVENVDGLIIGTRPDCVSDELLEKLAELNTFPGRVVIEYGAESSFDETLERINRCHTWAETVEATQKTVAKGIDVGLHFILGLPGETEEMMLETVRRLSELPVSTVKFHQLQVIRGTRLAKDIQQGLYDVKTFTVDEYISLCCKIVRSINPRIAIERFTSQSPDELLISPRWGLKNYEFVHCLNKKLSEMI
ncbi:MAG: TIGR01212 family radical SAM protein [Muribaculaceae bacterium]